jgi:histidine phosphotransfer protein HptB
MIDWDRISELRHEIGDDDFSEVAALFLSEMQCAMERLETNQNSETLESDLHFIKGSALNLGFSHLSQLCSDAEKLAATMDFATIELVAISNAYADSKSEFMAVLS